MRRLTIWSIVFNPGAPNLARAFRESFTDVIVRYVDILILNEAEARCLTECTSEREVIDSLLSLVDTVVVTRGGRGSVIASQGKVDEIGAVPVDVVDTTGAGGAYAGGFIYGLCQGWDMKRAGKLASKLAAQAVGHLGARPH
ncbi:MAG: hypothetical protein KAT75_07115 [Dehalococcoidia bacterium]|nr:hypothetical protein [Dehalococcoidia bacterium]